MESKTEQELRDEFKKSRSGLTRYEFLQKYINDEEFFMFKKGYSLAQETIKSKDAEISILKNSEKLNLHSNYVLICERQSKAIAEAREIIELYIEKMAFEVEEKAKAWLENNR